jgi:hypothetical protein
MIEWWQLLEMAAKTGPCYDVKIQDNCAFVGADKLLIG